MTTLNITKVNEAYIKVLAEPYIQAELSEFFTFQVPGYRFMPAYRARKWDGKLRLYSKATGKIYQGLLSYIYAFAKEREYKIDIEEGVYYNSKINKKDSDDFCNSLKPKSNGKDIEVRDYQLQAVYQVLKRHKLLLLSPTASGKSLIIYCMIRFFRMLNLKILVIVPTTSLVEQMYSDFFDYGMNESVHRIYYGHEKETEDNVIVSTWQSLATFEKDYFKQFDVVFGDEAHTFKSKSLTKIMTSLVNAKYRIGTTGTLDDTKTHKRNLCKSLDGNTLCLFQYVEKHGKILYDLIGDTLDPQTRKIFFVYGGTDTKDRETIRSITENEKNAIIVASFGTFSTGINIRNLHNIIFSSPSKSRIRNLQSIGRGLRLGDNKEKATLYDIADDLRIGAYKNYTLNHFSERINTYVGEEFDYEIHNINL